MEKFEGVNHSLEISGNPYEKSEILYVLMLIYPTFVVVVDEPAESPRGAREGVLAQTYGGRTNQGHTILSLL